MKKYFLGTLCITAILLLTGCGNKVVCTATYSEGGESASISTIARIGSDDKVTGLIVEYNFSKKETADIMCNTLKAYSNKYPEVSIDCSGSTVTIEGSTALNIASTNEDEKLTGITREEFIKRATENDFKCGK